MKMLQNILLGLCVLASSAAVADKRYSDLVAFGDSLSDPGNVFVVTGNVSVRPFAAGNIPSAPYPIGGMTFSNGKTWVQQLAASLGLRGSTGPALRTSTFSNYAFGGARASSSAGGAFDLNAQVAQYLADSGGNADRAALYSMYFGGNDVRDALSAFDTALQQTLLSGGTLPEALAAGQVAAEARLAEAITAIGDNIIVLALAGAGAQYFLVPNVPNLGLVPAITALGPDAATLATQLSFGFNLALEAALSDIEQALPVTITRFDVFALTSLLFVSPETFGLTNVTQACLTPEVMAGAICRNPNDYLFWDGLHPTAATHKILAEVALSEL